LLKNIDPESSTTKLIWVASRSSSEATLQIVTRAAVTAGAKTTDKGADTTAATSRAHTNDRIKARLGLTQEKFNLAPDDPIYPSPLE
jgi:hypothetical protein